MRRLVKKKSINRAEAEHSRSVCLHEANVTVGLTSLLSVEGHQLGAGFDVVSLAGEGTSSNIVDPVLDLKTQSA